MLKDIIGKHYRPRINSRDKGYEILDWESEAAHHGRFSILVDQVDIRGMKLLDVGCGVGDLYGYLASFGMDIRYTGVDLLEEMTAEARRRYPAASFVSGDIFDDSVTLFPEASFDVVYSSGIFNLNLGNNREFLKNALPVFFSLAGKYVIFNLLDPGHPVQSERYAYFDPEEVLPWIREFTDSICVVRDYVPHDFTLICRVV